MHEYTKKQKYAIAYILMQIIEADAIAHPKEIEYFNSIMKDFAISTEESELIESLEYHTAIQIIKDIESKQKNNALELFRTMISIDGNNDPRETAIIDRL